MPRLLLWVALGVPSVVTSALGFSPARQLQAVESSRCSTKATAFFLDSIENASSGCAVSGTYQWQGSADPTDAERTSLCKCTVKPFEVPDCTWKKQGQYVVTVAQHVKFVLNCLGKVTPTVTVVPVSSLTTAPTTAAPKKNSSTPLDSSSSASSSSSSSSSPSPSSSSNSESPSPSYTLTIVSADIGVNASRCTDDEEITFQKSIEAASSWCLSKEVYDWAGTIDPTDDQVRRICECKVSNFVIPTCRIRKGMYLALLETHLRWIQDKCAHLPGESSSNAALIGGIIGGVAIIAILLGLLIYKRRQSRMEKTTSDTVHNGPRDGPVVSSPINYQVIVRTPQDVRATSSTATGPSSLGERPSVRDSERVSWDDPTIATVRIPHDAIFFGALLSRGGFGEVYMGTYKGENVAIKQLRPERRKEMAQIEIFLAEVKLIASIEHERIVRFIGVAWNSLSDACMVIEYLENGDLRSVLNRWEQDLKQNKRNARPHGFDADKTKIALHVSHALAYLHSLQPVVVHRDLKPANILLNRNYDAKVTDFGISRERGESTMTANIGSVLWMAPEVMLGERYDEKADIFSFGVIMSELDTHQLPYFHAKEAATGEKMPDAAIMQLVMLGRLEVAFTNRTDLELAELGRECVSLDPKKRPTAAQVLHRVHQIHRKYT